jgi:regulator of protease activity HflC (stomatin/prohibitin superfamily)
VNGRDRGSSASELGEQGSPRGEEMNEASQQPGGRGRRLRQWLRRHNLGLTIGVLLLLLAISYLAPDIFIFIGAGERGVLWKRFGGGVVRDRVFSEGTTLIFPWDSMTIYNTRIQVVSQSFNALSSDGLAIQVESSIRYRPNLPQLALLHEEVGPNYLNVVVLPEIAAAMRGVIARYRQEELYTSDRLRLQKEIVDYAKGQTLERWVRIDDLQLRGVVLPVAMRQAIERKLAAEQHAQEYSFILQSEAKEAERKRIEAQGIRDFQAVVSAGISEQYLRWKGIDATLKLAESANAKVVVIGSGGNGLPIILNTEGASVAPPPRH